MPTGQTHFPSVTRSSLNRLIGTWAGPRETSTTSGVRTNNYEVRTFRKKPHFREPATSGWVVPIQFTVQIFDLNKRELPLREEVGQLLWIQDFDQVIQASADNRWQSVPTQVIVDHEADSICLDFRYDQAHLNDGEGEAFAEPNPSSLESVYIFDSETFRFDQSYLIQTSDLKSVTCRAIGELNRMN